MVGSHLIQLENSEQDKEMVEKYPEFPNLYEPIMKSRRVPEGMYNQLVGDLNIAGLQIDQ